MNEGWRIRLLKLTLRDQLARYTTEDHSDQSFGDVGTTETLGPLA